MKWIHYIVIVSGFYIFYSAIAEHRTGIESEYWKKTTGIMNNARVLHSVPPSPYGASTYSAIFSYTYEVNMVSYTGSRYGFAIPTYGTKVHAENIIKPFINNKPVSVYYSPDNPENSVLIKGASWASLLGQISASIFIILIGYNFKALLLWFRKSIFRLK